MAYQPAPIYERPLNPAGYFSTAWVQWFAQTVYAGIAKAQPGDNIPLGASNGGSAGIAIPYSREDHIHPTQTHNDLIGRSTAAAHPASAITVLPIGISATDTQAAFQELSIPQDGFGVISQPSYVNNGDGSVTIGTGVYALASAAGGDTRKTRYSIPGGVTTPTDGALSYLVASYNSGAPTLTLISDVTAINETTIVPVRTFFRSGTMVHQLDWDTLGLAKVDKLHQSVVKTQRFRRQSGLALSEVATRTIAVTAGIVWYGATALLNAAFSSATDLCDLYSHVAGVWTKSAITQYNNSQYDDGTTLQTLSANRYAVNFIYRLVNSEMSHSLVVLGTGDYKLGEAQVAQPPANLPPEIISMCILVGRIIVQKRAATATQIDSAFDLTFVPSQVTDHANLSGLQGGAAGEYYHLTAAQYALAATVGCLFTGTADATCGNSTSEISITPTGVGSLTIPAGLLGAGKTLRMRLAGIYSTKAAAAGNITIKINVGATVVLTTGAFALDNNETNKPWEIWACITCRTTGATGTVAANSMWKHGLSGGGATDALHAAPMVNVSPVTVNTTVSNAITATAQFSVADASNTITTSCLSLEIMN